MAEEPRFTHALRERARPDFEGSGTTVTLVDLFSGCGGLSLGVAQACHDFGAALDIRLAADFDATALGVLGTNFPKAHTAVEDIGQTLNGAPGADATPEERRLLGDVGAAQLLVAGPPCQGHSNLNNHTRRDDPKNELYRKVARAAEILSPTMVLIENVPSVVHDKNQVVQQTAGWLQEAGYRVADSVIRLNALGIPQRRQRHVLLATRSSLSLDPAVILSSVAECHTEEHDLRWAIGDLADMDGGTGIDLVPSASATNLERMHWLLKNDQHDLPNSRRPKCHQNEDHSYKSMYGRLTWEKPAQTLTSGFGSIGQGRYMHPNTREFRCLGSSRLLPA